MSSMMANNVTFNGQPFFPSLGKYINRVLWAYGDGGGSPTVSAAPSSMCFECCAGQSAGGVGATTDFVANPTYAVFTAVCRRCSSMSYCVFRCLARGLEIGAFKIASFALLWPLQVCLLVHSPHLFCC